MGYFYTLIWDYNGDGGGQERFDFEAPEDAARLAVLLMVSTLAPTPRVTIERHAGQSNRPTNRPPS